MRYGFETALYFDHVTAERTVSRLRDLGYFARDIIVVAKDAERARNFLVKSDVNSNAVVGSSLAVLIAALIGTGSLVAMAGLRGATTPLIIGPLAGVLAGLGVGAFNGSFHGALVAAGFSPERATECEIALDNGGILLGVHPREEDRSRIRKIFANSTPQVSHEPVLLFP